MDLCYLLKEESKKLYNTMKAAQELDIKIQEETLTELMLINLKASIQENTEENIQKKGLNTVIKHCNKSDEFNLGTDFLWFVGSKKKNSWVAFYIQAKKLRENQKYFLKHNYKNKTGNESAPIIRQVDKLITAAQDIHLGNKGRHSAIPIYCFYNYLNDETLKAADYLNDFLHISKKKEEFSFTYTSAYHVRSLLNQPFSAKQGTTKNTFPFSDLKGFPIYTLFCDTNTNQSLANHIFNTYKSFHTKLFSDRDSNYRFLLNDNEYIFPELPPFVESLIEDSKDTSGKYDEKDLPSYIMVTYED
ncbi:hypothetical protein COO08_19435 [Bacillus toyonensis]|uniref:DUF6615 family protein n=1 Tax=Bacillus toyonensis TaxID=155322 RepID=UPI000BEE729E|nr:DUF6615 family protein [Bacillus toyonensis]PEB16982.1 hypothetical protein COO08_19435 [Bacillus toyonensis]